MMSLFHSAGYRVKQYVNGLNASISAEDWLVIRSILTSDESELFARMPVEMQKHSIDVLSALKRAGHLHSELAVAALLHDVGKITADQAGVRLSLWLRSILVLWEKIWPGGLAQFASRETAHGWRYSAYVHLHHPTIGAELAATAGVGPTARWLIAVHQIKDHAKLDRESVPENGLELLSALQRADDVS